MKSFFAKRRKFFLKQWAKWALLLSVALLVAGALTEIFLNGSITNSLLSAAILVTIFVAYDRLRFESVKISKLRDHTGKIDAKLAELTAQTNALTIPESRPIGRNPSIAEIQPPSESATEIQRLVREQRYGLPTDWINALRNLANTAPQHGVIMFLGERTVFGRIQEFIGPKQASNFEFLDLTTEDRGKSQSQQSAEWSALIIQPASDLEIGISNSLLSKYMIRWMPAESRILKLASANPNKDEQVMNAIATNAGCLLKPSDYRGRAVRYIAIYNLEEV